MNQKDLDRMVSTGQIRGYKALSAPTTTQPAPARPTGAKAKQRLKGQLTLFCHLHKKLLLQEQMFHPLRKWRFDYLVAGPRPVAIEYEGIYNGKSRHTSVTGLHEDAEKYRAAALQGITVLRYTANSCGKVFNDLEKFYQL